MVGGPAAFKLADARLQFLFQNGLVCGYLGSGIHSVAGQLGGQAFLGRLSPLTRTWEGPTLCLMVDLGLQKAELGPSASPSVSYSRTIVIKTVQ